MKSQMQPLGLAFDWQRELATCDAGYYKWNQWFFLKMLGSRHRLPQDADRQLGPGGPDRARQRAGRGRPRLAQRRAGREARDPGLLPGDHEIRRRTAGRRQRPRAPGLPGRLARARAADAGALDRQERRRALRLPARHPRRRRRARSRTAACTSSRRAPTPSRASPSAPWRPSTRWPRTPRRPTPSSRPSSRSARRAAPPRPNWRCARRKAGPPGLSCTHPLTGEPVPVWVGNYVLMGYGDGAVMGVPAHDERDFAFAKKYGIDILQVIHVDGEHFSYEQLAGLVRRQAARRDHQFRQLQRPALPRRRWTPSPTRWRRRAWARRRPPGGCATGASAASATGARRSRSSTAPDCRRRAGAREGPAGRAARGPGARRQRQPAEQVRRRS